MMAPFLQGILLLAFIVCLVWLTVDQFLLAIVRTMG